MLATGGQIATRANAPELRAFAGLSDFGLPHAPTVTLIWRRDRMMHLIAGLAGALSFPLMVVAAIGSGMPFGIASSLSVAHLAAAAPGMSPAERARLSRIVSGLAILWGVLCLSAIAIGLAPLLFGWEALVSAIVAALPALSRIGTHRRGNASAMTGQDIACLETYAAGEAVIITDPRGRLLGSTWAARRAIGAPLHDGTPDIVQFVDMADRQALASALIRVAKTGTVESCVVTLADDTAGEPAMITIKPVELDRLAIILGTRMTAADREMALCPDPVHDALRGTLSLRGTAGHADPVDHNDHAESSNVREIVEFALRLVRRDAERADIAIEFSGDGCAMDVACEQRSLIQVLINLLNNAIKFSNHHGKVSVSARRLPGAALIRIADRGIGIAAEDQDRIFSFRGRSGDGTRHGYGLGLAIVRDLVEAAGGTIVLSSELGRGTTVDIRLPLAGDDKRSGARSAADPEQQSWQLAAE
jgi:anti-sigma regulatory factor (Ser/Thr protein kinase)